MAAGTRFEDGYVAMLERVADWAPSGHAVRSLLNCGMQRRSCKCCVMRDAGQDGPPVFRVTHAAADTIARKKKKNYGAIANRATSTLFGIIESENPSYPNAKRRC